MRGDGRVLAGMVLAGLVAGRPARAEEFDKRCKGDEVPGCGQLPITALVVTGSRALQPVVKAMSAALKKETGTEIYYLHTQSQCQGARQVVEGLDVSGGTDRLRETYDCCTLPPDTHADVWISDSPIEDCFGGQKPPGFREFLGPIATYSIVVPRASTQRAITAEEAYFVFGFGSAGYKGVTVAPWTDATHVLIPSDIYGARALWARFLRLPALPTPAARGAYTGPPDVMKGLERGSPDAVVSGMQFEELGGPGGIGLTTAQAYDTTEGARTATAPIKALAIQSFGQKYAFYADSTARAADRRNVREGRYPYWAPIRIVVKTDATGRPLNFRADSLINYLQQKVSMPGFNVLDSIVAGRLVPSCAMKVQRKTDTGDAGELVPYVPPAGTACGCYMDEVLQRGSSGCQACSASVPCATGKTCSNGYCE